MTAEASLQQRFGLTVTPQNVLGIRAVVLQEAQDLEDHLDAERERVMLRPLGHDPVSKDMAIAFNDLTTSLMIRAKEHVATLFKLGEELAATALAYGNTDDDVRASFTPDSARSSASRVSPALRQIAGMGVTGQRPRPLSVADMLTGGTP